jgi:hypothetical protein
MITKYLDNMQLSCYSAIIRHHIMLIGASIRIKTGLDLFYFWWDCHKLLHSGFFCGNDPE